jgi:hypothetical protein
VQGALTLALRCKPREAGVFFFDENPLLFLSLLTATQFKIAFLWEKGIGDTGGEENEKEKTHFIVITCGADYLRLHRDA